MTRDTDTTVDHERQDHVPEDERPEEESGPEGQGGTDDADRGGEAPPGDGDSSDSASGEELERELADLNDRHLRLAAEFNNYRRRQETERLELWSRAQADLVGRLLDVLDDLQRVGSLELEDESVTAESIVEGIDLVERKFVRTLDEAGVEVVDPSDGERFDPETMEAMMRVPAEDDGLDDRIARTFQKGYLFKGSLVRPARVSVYKS